MITMGAGFAQARKNHLLLGHFCGRAERACKNVPVFPILPVIAVAT
jgi:hypothetical protein